PSVEQLDASQTKALAIVMERVAHGRPIDEPELRLSQGTRFYILGLSPNAARLSVRFWEASTLGRIGCAFHRHWRDMHIEMRGPTSLPSVASCVLMTAPARPDRNGNYKLDFDGVSPLLGGELMRAILTESRYPASLLTILVMRIRTDHY